tara:strand:+ start:3120 stop:3332 length:213 start_codon:yes stop_codon:yes gene_type:complete
MIIMGNLLQKSETNLNNNRDLDKPLLATELQEIHKTIAYLDSKIDMLDDKLWVFESKTNSKINKLSKGHI